MGKKFSKNHQRLAGWGRARQLAEERRRNPSPAEAKVQQYLKEIGAVFSAEHEIIHPDGMPQWVDILVVDPRMLAIEVDGSHGWHNYNGRNTNGKMDAYDERKVKLLESYKVPLLRINTCSYDYQWQAVIKMALYQDYS